MKSGLVLLSIASVSLLSACGGGSSGGAGNSAPQVSNLQVVDENGGGLAIGDTLRATYTYSDVEGDVEGESVITWLRDGVAITGATGKTYVLTWADIGKKISFSVLAKALTGTLEGTLTLENAAPTATNVALSGTTTVGQTLTGTYTYADADSDAQGTSTFRWLRNDVAISGATSTTYTLTADDVGKTIKFAVTPVAAAGTTTGTEVTSAASAAVTAVNAAPTATNVALSGTTTVGQTLTGTYTYADADSDAQGTSTFRWLRNDVAVSGATSATYTLTAADLGATIKFAVTPVAAAGTTTGTEVTSAASATIIATTPATVQISGKVEFQRILDKTTGLDYTNPVVSPVRKAKVEALNGAGTILTSATTDTSGNYTLTVNSNTDVKIRVKAEMPDYQLTVVDNTSSGALYSLDGSLTSSGTANSTRDLLATSGWNGTAYSSNADRKAAPFAILDSMYLSSKKIQDANPSATFVALPVNWSVNNVPSGGNKALGQISTSHYSAGNLYILGKENTDTDEFDDHVMIHEWGHYFEDKFSRSDSIGGSHGDGDILDIRLAFGEAWGNALSGMVTDDPMYIDTTGTAQSNGGGFSVETQTANQPGFYSESSLQRVLYDLYDATADGADNVALGFTPIYNVMVGGEKNAIAYTSIFTFIKALIDSNAASATDINAVAGMENMQSITDVYGSTQTDNRSSNANVLPLYTDLTVGATSGTVCSDGSLSSSNAGNRLSVYRFFKFNIATAGNYTIRVQRVSGVQPANYTFNVSKGSPFTKNVLQGSNVMTDTQVEAGTLSAGDYVMEVYEDSLKGGATGSACYTVSVEVTPSP